MKVATTNLIYSVDKISGGVGSDIAFYKVTDAAGRLIGFLRKGKNTRTETCPWQPFRVAAGGVMGEALPDPDSPSGFMACYGENGIERAVGALAVDDAMGAYA